MSTRSRETYVAVAAEAVPGQAADVADLRLLDADFTSPQFEASKPLRSDASSLHSMPGVPALAGTTATIEIKVPADIASEVRADAADPISPPPYDVLLQACGLERVDNVAARTATYSLGGETSCTIAWRAGNRLFQMVGCRGTFSLTADAGGDLMIEFSMMGRAQVVHTGTQAARPAAAGIAYRRTRTFGAEVVVAHVAPDGGGGNAIALGDALLGVGMELGAQLTRPGDITAPDGAALPVITAIQTTQQLNMISPDLQAGAADEFWALVNGEGLLSLTAKFPSPDADASLTTVLGSAAATNAENTDADGLVSQQITASGVDVAAEPVALIFTTPAI